MLTKQYVHEFQYIYHTPACDDRNLICLDSVSNCNYSNVKLICHEVDSFRTYAKTTLYVEKTVIFHIQPLLNLIVLQTSQEVNSLVNLTRKPTVSILNIASFPTEKLI